ncbi:MAG: hypothetical protein V3U80_02310 [Flavobacteriaceae bacterium]
MTKSIEQIWKEGFLRTDSLIAPQVVSIYNKKSMHIVDKFKRTFKINYYAIFIFSILNFFLYNHLGFPYIGGIIFFLLIGILIRSNKHKKKLENLDTNVSSFQYLTSFKNWLNDSINENKKMMRIFYPSMFLLAIFTIASPLLKTEEFKEFLQNSDLYLIKGIPLVFIIGVLFVIGTVTYYSDKIYLWDLKLVYGKMYSKLDDLISEIELLRSAEK